MARSVGPVRPEAENLDAGRQMRIEQPIVPVGRLMKCVAFGESRDGAGNTVALAVLFEVENAALLSAQPRGKRGTGPEERGHEIREARRLLEIAPLQGLEHLLVALAWIVRLLVLVPEQLGAGLWLCLDDEHDDARRKLLTLECRNARPHPRRGPAAVLPGRHLSQAALPADEFAAQGLGGGTGQ